MKTHQMLSASCMVTCTLFGIVIQNTKVDKKFKQDLHLNHVYNTNACFAGLNSMYIIYLNNNQEKNK